MLEYNPVLGVVRRSGTHCLSLDSIYCYPVPVALLYIHYECAGFLHRCCGESNMSASPGVDLPSGSVSSCSISAWPISHCVHGVDIFWLIFWSGCGGISTGITSSQSMSWTSWCDEAGVLHSAIFAANFCVEIMNPCVSG